MTCFCRHGLDGPFPAHAQRDAGLLTGRPEADLRTGLASSEDMAQAEKAAAERLSQHGEVAYRWSETQEALAEPSPRGAGLDEDTP